MAQGNRIDIAGDGKSVHRNSHPVADVKGLKEGDQKSVNDIGYSLLENKAQNGYDQGGGHEELGSQACKESECIKDPDASHDHNKCL